MKLRERCICNLFYGGIKKEEFEEIEEEILEKDRSSLSMTSICLLLMFSGLFTGSLFSEMMATNRMAYGIVGVCFALIFCICHLMKKKVSKLILPLWYLAMTLMSGYAIILNTVIRNDISATTFCVIMIVAPLLIMDRPWRVLAYFVLVIVVFIPIDFHQKSYYLAYTDTVNVICCGSLGTVIHFNIMRTKLREMTQRLYIEKQRDTDKLTACLTKAAFERKIVERMEKNEREGVLIVMDVDHFKSVNDNYGHIFGDMVLHKVGEDICQSFPKSALCGRFGGDEFVIWIPGKYTRKEIVVYLVELTNQVRSIKTPDGRIQITLSIGIAMCPPNGKKYAELFENADAALYSAKNLGRNRFIFCPESGIGKEA